MFFRRDAQRANYYLLPIQNVKQVTLYLYLVKHSTLIYPRVTIFNYGKTVKKTFLETKFLTQQKRTERQA